MSGLGGRCLLKRGFTQTSVCLLRTTELSVSGLPSPWTWFGAFGQGLLEGGKSATGLIRHGFPNELDEFGWKDEA